RRAGSLEDVAPSAGQRPSPVGHFLDQQDPAVLVKDSRAHVDFGCRVARGERRGGTIAAEVVANEELLGEHGEALEALDVEVISRVSQTVLRDRGELDGEFTHV